jgi:hypothetical protein
MVKDLSAGGEGYYMQLEKVSRCQRKFVALRSFCLGEGKRGGTRLMADLVRVMHSMNVSMTKVRML